MVKDLGGRFAAQHARLDAALVSAARQLGVALPAEPDADQKSTAAKLDAAAIAAHHEALVKAAPSFGVPQR